MNSLKLYTEILQFCRIYTEFPEDSHKNTRYTCTQVRDLIYREILEYHPQMLADHLSNGMSRGANFMYPSAVDNFRRQCAPL